MDFRESILVTSSHHSSMNGPLYLYDLSCDCKADAYIHALIINQDNYNGYIEIDVNPRILDED